MSGKNKHGFDDDEMALLTEEERAGMEESDAEDGEDGEDGEGADEGEGGDDEAAKAVADAAAAEEAAKADADDGKASADDGPEPYKPTPLIKADAPADATAKIGEIDKALDALDERFDAGELTAKELRVEARKLYDQREELNQSVFKSKLSEEMSQQQELDAWKRDVKDFLDEHKEISENRLKFSAFDTAVREVTADEANSGLSNRKALRLAYKTWTESLGFKVEAEPKPEPAADKDPKVVADPKIKPKRELPPLLAKVPAADMQDLSDGKYAAIDRLMDTDPVRYEAELAKLSDAEQEAYLQAR